MKADKDVEVATVIQPESHTDGSTPVAMHSPGPWSVHSHFREYIVPASHATRPVGGSVDDAHDRETYVQEICSLGREPRHRSIAEVRANGRLIAAAPELLELVRYMRKSLRTMPIYFTPQLDKRLNKLLNRIDGKEPA